MDKDSESKQKQTLHINSKLSNADDQRLKALMHNRSFTDRHQQTTSEKVTHQVSVEYDNLTISAPDFVELTKSDAAIASKLLDIMKPNDARNLFQCLLTLPDATLESLTETLGKETIQKLLTPTPVPTLTQHTRPQTSPSQSLEESFKLLEMLGNLGPGNYAIENEIGGSLKQTGPKNQAARNAMGGGLQQTGEHNASVKNKTNLDATQTSPGLG